MLVRLGELCKHDSFPILPSQWPCDTVQGRTFAPPEALEGVGFLYGLDHQCLSASMMLRVKVGEGCSRKRIVGESRFSPRI